MKIIKDFQSMDDPLNVDNFITSKVDMYKLWALTFLVGSIQAINYKIIRFIFSMICLQACCMLD